MPFSSLEVFTSGDGAQTQMLHRNSIRRDFARLPTSPTPRWCHLILVTYLAAREISFLSCQDTTMYISLRFSSMVRCIFAIMAHHVGVSHLGFMFCYSAQRGCFCTIWVEMTVDSEWWMTKSWIHDRDHVVCFEELSGRARWCLRMGKRKLVLMQFL